MSLKFPDPKDPDEVKRYTLDWGTKHLITGETLSTATWTVPTGLTKDSESNTTTQSSVVVSGGTAGTTYSLICTVTTSESLTRQRTVDLRVKSL